MNAEASQGNSLRPCPFCGHLESATADRCRRCRLALDQKALHGLKRLMGVWHLLDERSPTSPGVNWQKFRQLIESDHVYEDSIIRGPATRGVWQYAKDTPSVATLLGLCWSCHCRLPDGRATHCPRCEVELNGPLDWPTTEEGKGGVQEPIAALPAEEDLLASGTGEREFRKVSEGMTWKGLLLRLLGFLAVGAACAGVFWYSFLFAWHGRLVGRDERIVAARPAAPAKAAAEEKNVPSPTMPSQDQGEGDMESSPPQVAALTPPPVPAAPAPVTPAPAAPTPVAPATPEAPPPAASTPTPAPAASTPPAPASPVTPAAAAPPAVAAAPAAPVVAAAPARTSALPPFQPPRPIVMAPVTVEPQERPTPVAPALPAGNPAPPSSVFEPRQPAIMPNPSLPQETPTPVPVAPAGVEVAAKGPSTPAAAPSTRPAEPEQPEPEGAREIYSAKIIFAIARQAQADGDLVKAQVLLQEMMATHDKKVWPVDANDMLEATQKLIRSSPRPKEPPQADLTKMWQEAKDLSDEALKLEKQNDLPQAFNKLATVIYRYPSTVWPKNTFECFRRVIHNMRKQDLPPLP